MPDVIHTIVPENTRSIALAERLGSVHRVPTCMPPPLEAIEADLSSQTADQWRARAR